jgi:hypothetical protein
MKSKICIICSETKLLNEFYAHKQMGDGTINKCKDCCKKQAIERSRILSENPEWVEKERARGREKFKRLNYKDKQKDKDLLKNWKKSSRYYNLRRWYKTKYGFLDPNIELHHWSYKDEHLRDIILLTRSAHKRVHNHLVLSIENKCFTTLDGILLDTKEKHLNYINTLTLT